MKGALQVAKAFGIPVRVHWTFALIIAWVVYLVFSRTGGFSLEYMISQSVFILALFFCVVLHEFGHALTARIYDIQTLDIILFPIGGVARLDQMPEKPMQEFWVAIAGPLVNFAIIIVLFLFFFLTASSEKFNLFLQNPLFILDPKSNFFYSGFTRTDIFIISLMVINGILGFFNLLPAFPLDGGRIFRALLTIRTNRLSATRIAANLGKVMAVGLVVYGLWQMDLILAFIGLFVFNMADGEYKSVKWEVFLKGHTVENVLNRHYTFFHQDDTLADVRNSMNDYNQSKHFLVFDRQSNELIGYIHKKQVKEKPQEDPDQVIEPIIRRFRERLSPTDDLNQAFFAMQANNTPILPVYEFEELVGVIDQDGLNDYLDRQEI